MALSSGQYSREENRKGQTSVTVYSDYSFANPESAVDQTRLSPTFCLGMLKISIDPRDQSNPKPYPTYDDKAGVSIYLTHTKALLLLNDIEEFEKNPSMATSVGVDSGRGDKQGLIQITNGAEFGTTNRCIVIRKIGMDDHNNPYVSASFAYELKEDNYHYTIRNFNPEDPTQFDKVYQNNTELEQFKTLLRQYIEAQTNAMAYSLMEQMKYNNSRVNTKLDLVMEKLGIEKKTYGNNGGGNSTSIFQNSGNNNRSFSNSTIDDINNL